MLKIIRTEDGSQSLYDEELNETYHSTKGARAESEYVFLRMGLDFFCRQSTDDSRRQIRLLEVGFGTGLNAWLTWKWAEQHTQAVHFHTLEPFPVALDIVQQMDLSIDDQFMAVHQAEWNQVTKCSDYFSLFKSTSKLEEAHFMDSFDCVFFDAFAPSKQPDVWMIENLKKSYDALKPGGVLTTYCAQGQFKRNLAAVGFDVEVLPGALGKKEMVRGRKMG